MFNLVLLAKWKWRLEYEISDLWKDIVQSKYGCRRSTGKAIAAKSQEGGRILRL